MTNEINIECTGEGVRFIYSDALRPLMAHGEARITRASHVEPGDPARGQDATKWYADMSPVGGPVLEGCDSRDEALRKEVTWLQENNLGLSRSSPATAT